MRRITVERGVATLHDGDERIGQWQAGPDDYAAAGIDWPGCDCGDDPCRHGVAHHWGVMPSVAEVREMAGIA